MIVIRNGCRKVAVLHIFYGAAAAAAAARSVHTLLLLQTRNLMRILLFQQWQENGNVCSSTWKWK